MSCNEQILAQAKSASVTTLGDALETDAVSKSAIDALLCSRVVSALLECDGVTTETLPWPEIPRHFEAQLEVLWCHYQAEGANCERLEGAFDRIAAELYELTIDHLMLLQMSSDECTNCT